jgi:MATE family multidrug resistance protein
VQPELIAPATTYLLVRIIGIAPHLLFLVCRAYLQANGVTRPMLVAMIAGNVFNLLADILFVFGGRVLPSWSGPLQRIPAYGVSGAAIATVLGTLLQLWIVASAVRRIAPAGLTGTRRWHGAEVAQAFRVGFPLGLQLGAEIGVFALVGVLAARLGTLELAAHQTVLSMASFTYTVSLGIAAAASVRVGIGIGARDVTATRAAGRAALTAGAFVMAIPALLFLLIPRPLVRLLTDSEAVITASIPLLVVAAVFQLSDGIQAVGAGALRGAGDTRFSMISNLAGHWVIGLPIALYLGFRHHLGIVGLWWGLCAGLTVVAALLFVRFERISRKTIAPIQVATSHAL